MIAPTAQRVPENTSAEVNANIRRRTESRVACFASGGRDAIAGRLKELDREWDIERMLETMASSFALTGLSLGALVNRRWFLFPAVVLAFLLQHAVQGWCPPVPVLRRLGFRTADEINCERYALKALRGDFHEIEPIAESQATQKAAKALEAVQC